MARASCEKTVECTPSRHQNEYMPSIASENRSFLRMKRLLRGFAARRLDDASRRLNYVQNFTVAENYHYGNLEIMDLLDSITQFWNVMNHNLRQAFHRLLSRLHFSVFDYYRKSHLLQYKVHAKYCPYVVCVLPRMRSNLSTDAYHRLFFREKNRLFVFFKEAKLSFYT